jgi:hypothetical protein
MQHIDDSRAGKLHVAAPAQSAKKDEIGFWVKFKPISKM